MTLSGSQFPFPAIRAFLRRNPGTRLELLYSEFTNASIARVLRATSNVEIARAEGPLFEIALRLLDAEFPSPPETNDAPSSD